MNTLDLQNKITQHHTAANEYYNQGQYQDAIYELEQALKYCQTPEDQEIIQQNIQTIVQTMQEQAMQNEPQYTENEGPEHQKRLLIVTVIVGAICLSSVAWKCYDIYSNASPQKSSVVRVNTPQKITPAVTPPSIEPNNDTETANLNTPTQEESAPTSELASGPKMFIKGTGVNMRSEPSTSAATVSTLSKGDEVQIVSSETQEANGYTWQKVQTTSMQTGWVASSFLRQEAPSQISTLNTKMVNGDQVSLRSEPSVKGELINRLAQNTEVKVVSEKAVTADGYLWTKIESAQGNGWIADKFLN